MKEIERNNNYVTFETVNKNYKCVYTMVNMGDYVGFIDRSFSEKGMDDYYLLFLDGYVNDEKLFQVESLVSESGKYIRFIVIFKDFERVIRTDGEYVISDTIFAHDTAYNSDILYMDYELDYYLKQSLRFISPNDEEYKCEVPTSKIIEQFISKNKELKEEIKLKKTSN
jgi:hypothetical protein